MSLSQTPTIVGRPRVKLNGTAITLDLEQNLVEARVELVSNGVSEATLRFYDASFELVDSALNLADELEVAFPVAGTSEMKIVFGGEIVSFAAEQGPNDLHEFVVTALDRGHRMGRSFKPRVWANVAYRDIVSTIAQENGLRSQITNLSGTVFPHLMQTTDDASFLTTMGERAGFTWHVVAGVLIVNGGDEAATTATWGKELRRFTTRIGGPGPVDQVEVRGWDVKAKRAIVATAAANTTRLSDASATAGARTKLYGISSAKRVVSNRITDSQDEATAVADALRERMDSAVTSARGEVWGDPTLLPGKKLKIEGVGTKLGGTYVLTSVQHIYNPQAFVTRFQAGTRTSSGLVDLLSGGSKPQGATIGVVTNNGNDPDGMARVKVKLPMLDESIESDWARVVTLGGGSARGLQITPAVGDEVLVVFEGGDTRRPIVVGGLWNGVDLPPKPTSETTASGATKVWHFQTAAGHQLTFDERDAGSEHVTILLKDGKTKLHLGVDKIELWADQQNVQVKSGQASVTLASGNVTIEAMNINLKAKNAVKIEGINVEIAAQASAKVAGQATVDVQGAMANVQASGVASIKGAMVKIN